MSLPVTLRVVEICAGAGGQALGLELAGFEHELAVEIDPHAAQTLRNNRPWKVAVGDVADPEVWRPSDYHGVDLLAGGVPCPPFSIAGKQLGSGDERDLFAWAVELACTMQPRALMLENVRGLSMPRFSAYRQAVLDRLAEAGYVGDWALLQASDYGVPQLRPRFVLIALRAEDAPYFAWPEPVAIDSRPTLGQTLVAPMGANGWKHAEEWAHAVDAVSTIAPTIVGGSKRHGGADLGPTRAKRQWRTMHVDAMGLANAAPSDDAEHFLVRPPKLTVDMVALVQGWRPDWEWEFAGLKTARYRQIGNAFPPPLARAVGESIRRALTPEERSATGAAFTDQVTHDDVYRVLRDSGDFVALDELANLVGGGYSADKLTKRLNHLGRDFHIEWRETGAGAVAVRLGDFKAFVGQDDHHRHDAFAVKSGRARIS